MIQRSASFQATTRLAAFIAATGLLFVAPALAQTQLPPPQQYGSADARQDRIEELQQQLTEATAENERLQHQLNQRDREIQRLRSMVGELAGVNQQLATPPADGAPTTGGAPPNAPRADAGPAPSGLNSAQQAQTGTLGTVPAASVPAAPAPALSADETYARAMGYLTAGNNAQAEATFADFLERFPNVTQTANARYWYGFTLLAGGKHRDAAASFYQYLQRAPRGPRAPEAQVGLGMALLGMGERQQGCAALNSVPRQYPNSDQAVRTRAAREARAANCAA